MVNELNTQLAAHATAAGTVVSSLTPPKPGTYRNLAIRPSGEMVVGAGPMPLPTWTYPVSKFDGTLLVKSDAR